MYLLIGDMHVKKDNIDESLKLINWITCLCLDRKLIPVFMGDQYDKHGIIHAEVLDFWVNSFSQMKNSGIDRIIAIRGNHDMNGSGEYSSMVAHSDSVVDIRCSCEIGNNIWAIPYHKSNDDFIVEVKSAYENKAKIILCHQEFDGAKYDNGFYAPHGVKLEQLPDMNYISGHIHTKQRLAGGKIEYIGSPRQFTISDAGVEKFVAIMHINGAIDYIKVPETICEPFKVFEIGPDCKKLPDIPDSVKSIIKISGNKDFCYKIAGKLPPNVKVRISVVSEKSNVQIKESDGISIAFKKFVNQYSQEKALLSDEISSIYKKISEKCPGLINE